MLARHLVEVTLQTLVAAMSAEALRRLWKLEDTEVIVRLRLIVVAIALLSLPLFESLAPFRHTEWFRDHRALYVFDRIALVQVAGI